jgi:hypothetical protein
VRISTTAAVAASVLLASCSGGGGGGDSNRMPIAQAGAPQTVYKTTPVTLDGRGSSDPDRDTLTYNWVQTAGTPVTLFNAATGTPNFTRRTPRVI